VTVQTDREPAAEELEAKYREIIKTHLAASAAPRPEKVSPRDEPKAQLEEIIVRSAAPSKESQRRAMVRAMLVHLETSESLNDRVFLLRQLAVVGREEAVRPLGQLLKTTEHPVLREYALGALERNSAPSASRALAESLREAKEPEWRIAIAGALGRRRRSDGPESVALAALLRDSDLKVAAAAAIASGSIGTPRDVETLWDEARKARKELLPALHEAILLGAERLCERGQKDAAWAAYREVHAAAANPLVKMSALRGMVLSKPGEAVSAVIQALQSDDPETQAWAARLAVDIPGEEATKAFRAAMPQLAASARAFLSDALAERETK
jgi:hypothetical protein